MDVPLAHLDRAFDYQVPERLAEAAVPGCRVRVRFAGRLVDGFLLERVTASEHPGQLGWLERVVSPEPVLTGPIAALARAVADRCAGTLPDVLRLAVPPRHGRAEDEPPRPTAPTPPRPAAAGWRCYPRGPAFLEAVHDRRAAHAAWQALPGEDWPARLAEAAGTAAAAGRGALLVLPDHRDVARVHAACAELLGPDAVVALTADLGPAERYRRWLAVLRAAVRVVVGTRAAAFAPVADLGLAMLWDDGDDLHVEPRAPYPHTRLVLGQRAVIEGTALLVAGFARTAETQLLVESGWAHEITAPRTAVRAAAPRVTALAEDGTRCADEPAVRAARLPGRAFEAARGALSAATPVLVQVPRRGYLPAVACDRCRHRARCRSCAGPLALPDRAGNPSCRWCGARSAFRCPECGHRELRALVVGARRTAEELGRAFPRVPVRFSGAGDRLGTVPATAALVVSTPGAEPLAADGYGAALLLDGWALLGRPDLRAAEEALRRWMTAAALVRGGDKGGRVVVVAESTLGPVQALVRWDPAGHAAAELATRHELGFPPVTRMAAVEGTPAALQELLAATELPPGTEALGPVPLPGKAGDDPERERLLLRVDRRHGRELAAALAVGQAVRSARKDADPVRVHLDPPELG